MQEVVVIFKEPWYNEYFQESKKHNNGEYKQSPECQPRHIQRENDGLQKLFGKQESVDYKNLQAMWMRDFRKNKS